MTCKRAKLTGTGVSVKYDSTSVSWVMYSVSAKGHLSENKRHRTNLLVVCFLFGFGVTTPGATHERSRSVSECLSVQMYLG